jgi:hypothetical protein
MSLYRIILIQNRMVSIAKFSSRLAVFRIRISTRYLNFRQCCGRIETNADPDPWMS